MAPPRSTPNILRDIRKLRVVVFHPNDPDGQELMQQLNRIGCHAHASWPPAPEMAAACDLVFFAVRPDTRESCLSWCRADDAPAVIAVINYENPTIVDMVLRLGAKGVVSKPVRSTGILSSIVIALSLNREIGAIEKKTKRLEQKLAGLNKINDAKMILIRTRNLDEVEAYRVMREQAMSKRTSVEEIASAIINASQVLSRY